MKRLRTIRSRFKARSGDRTAGRRLRCLFRAMLAIAPPLFVVVFVGTWAGTAGAGEPNAGGAPAWAAGQPQSTAPVFSATVHVLPSGRNLTVGESFWVRVAISVSEGCQFPIYELTLDQDPPLFAYTSPSTATVGPPVSNPFTYTLTAVQPGRAVLGAVAYGERYCGDFWNWHYLYGSSEPVTVWEPHNAYLPLVSRSCALDVHAVDMWPEPPGPLDRQTAFAFGSRISYTADCETVAHVVAFCAYPGETIPDCYERQILPDRPFWMNQQTFSPGAHAFEQGFLYDTSLDPDYDRLVLRVSVLGLYCEQEMYTLMP